MSKKRQTLSERKAMIEELTFQGVARGEMPASLFWPPDEELERQDRIDEIATAVEERIRKNLIPEIGAEVDRRIWVFVKGFLIGAVIIAVVRGLISN